MLSPPYLWLHVGGIGVLGGGGSCHDIHIDLSGSACLAGTVRVHDNGSGALFALAGQQREIDVGHDNGLTGAELDSVRQGVVLEIIAKHTITGDVEGALSGGLGGHFAVADVGLVLALRVQLGINVSDAALDNHIVTDFASGRRGNINGQNKIVGSGNAGIGRRRLLARHKGRKFHFSFPLSVGKIVHSHQNLMIFCVIVVPGEHCRPGVAGNFSCLFPIPQIRQWAAGYGPVTNSIQDFIGFQPVVVTGWLQTIDDFELILPLIRPANVFLCFVGPLDGRKRHTRLIGRKVFKGDIGRLIFVLIQPNQ
nr:MAG TPA: hypothetical protein [Caudoviricetes sp.]